MRRILPAIIVYWVASASLAPINETWAQPTPPRPPFEIWITNQVRDSVQVFDSRSLKMTAEIPVDDDGRSGTSKPHTITLSADGRFAYVANVGARRETNNIVIIRTGDRKIVATLPAGPGTHMVVPSPTGGEAYAANAGGNTLTEILTDTNQVNFRKGRVMTIRGRNDSKSHPICIGSSRDGSKLFVTNAGDPKGNPDTTGFVSVINAASGTETARIPDLGNESCGFARTKDGGRLYFTMGGALREFAVIDAESDRIILRQASGGKDPHGVALIPGGHQVWITNRLSNNVSVFSATTGAHFRTFFDIGDKPDLLDFSPDGEKVIITLRGDPATPMPGGPGREPGFVILDTESGKVLSKVAIDGDPHGIAVLSRKR